LILFLGNGDGNGRNCITDEGCKFISEFCSIHRNLLVLELSLDQKPHKITDEGLYSIIIGLQYCKNLRTFFINASLDDHQLSDKGLEHFWLLKGLTNLRKLDLRFIATKSTVTDKGLAYIGETIQNFKELRTFILAICQSPETKFTDAGLCCLIEGVRTCEFLEEVGIDCGHNDNLFTNIGFKVFADTVRTLNYLENINFCISAAGEKVNDEGLLYFSNTFKKKPRVV